MLGTGGEIKDRPLGPTCAGGGFTLSDVTEQQEPHLLQWGMQYGLSLRGLSRLRSAADNGVGRTYTLTQCCVLYGSAVRGRWRLSSKVLYMKTHVKKRKIWRFYFTIPFLDSFTELDLVSFGET